MKKTSCLLLLLYTILGFAQNNTHVYLFDLKIEGSTLILSNKTKISDGIGYHNQPSFYGNNTVLFSSTRNGQTDIKRYRISSKKSDWLTDTGFGSEYSPQRIANSNDISAVRLDTTGLQRLYRYKVRSGESSPIFKDAKIGYYTWLDNTTLASTQLVDEGMNLVLSDIKAGVNFTVRQNVGRSVLKVPNSNEISYMVNGEETNQLWTYNTKTEQALGIISVRRAKDFCWLPNGTLLGSVDNYIVSFKRGESTEWQIAHQFKDPDLQSISRITVNPSGDKLALVSGPSPSYYVDVQLEAYNNRDIDAFVDTYSDDITLYDFPQTLTSEGKEALREGYGKFFESTPDLHCTITNRTIFGNKVIDVEEITANGRRFTAMAIYEVENGKIVRVTFVR